MYTCDINIPHMHIRITHTYANTHGHSAQEIVRINQKEEEYYTIGERLTIRKIRRA